MLDDFGKGSSASAGRFGVSLVVSLALFGSVGAGVVFASAMAYRAAAEEDLLQVEFAPPPEPEPPPPPPPPPPQVEEAPPPPPRGRPRPELEQPIEVPDEPPEESDDELAPPDDPFAPEGEGDPNGVIGGTGPIQPAVAPPPPPEPEPEPEPVRPRGPQRVIEGTTPPQFDRAEIAQNFEIPPEVRSAGIARITVVVRVTVDADGNLTDVTVLRGHALIPNDTIVRAVRATRFQPARMGDGTPYAAIHTIPITLAVTL